jgi:hypothetical protein
VAARVVGEQRVARAHRVVEQAGQLVELAGAAQEVDHGHAVDEIGPVALGHAPEHAHDQPGAGLLGLLHLAEAAPDLLLGALADRAGVVEHDVRGWRRS